MSGTNWPALTAGNKAKASEVEEKFDWIEGDILPMIGGTKTDATYNLGSATYRWNTAYFSGIVYIGGDDIKKWAMMHSLLNSD